jgi:antibiotic biosynthesis monooxygenase (ABM) superfamily enzyme
VIVYEVTLRVEAEIAEAYLHWLRDHMQQMLRLPGFLAAELFAVDDAEAEANGHRYCAQYRLRDAQALAHYLSEHAPRLRAEGTTRFGTRFSAQRRVLRPLATT